MYPSLQWLNEFQETCQALQQDILLLEALTLHTEQAEIRNPILNGSFHRLLDYLSQDADDLRCLGRKLEKGTEAKQPASSET